MSGELGWTPDGASGRQTIKVGLALSGGGYRAMLFHLGALYRLNELGQLGRLEAVSSVSGGSFAAAILAGAWPRLDFADGRAINFETEVAQPIERLSRRHLDIPIVALGMLPFVNPANVLAFVLDRLQFHGLRLDQLPDSPLFVFNATHLATGAAWYFSKPFMGTYRLGWIDAPSTAVATAVAASAAFPPIVSPLILRTRPESFRKGRFSTIDDPGMLRSSLLLDGGAYDNLGVQFFDAPQVDTLFVSDGGGNLSVDGRHWRYSLWTVQLKRVLDMAVDQGRDLRRSDLIRAQAAGQYKTLALWRTTTNPDKFPHLTRPFPVSQAWRDYLSTLPTRMWPFSRRDRDALVDWGYLAADLGLRAYACKGAPAPVALPRGTEFGQPPQARAVTRVLPIAPESVDQP
jgi:NTE family protein